MNNFSNDLILIGATGRLGTSILKTNTISYGISSKENPLIGKKIDCLLNPLLGSLDEIPIKKLKQPTLIDASYPENFERICNFCSLHKVPLVLASTGHSKEQIQDLNNLSKKIPILLAPNLSRGIAFFKIKLLMPITDDIKKNLLENPKQRFSVNIIETHHEKKKDSPSGTALDLKRFIETQLNNQVDLKINSIRDKSSVGKHEVIFSLNNEEIIITHNALNRNIFGEGAKYSRYLNDKDPGLYKIEDFIN